MAPFYSEPFFKRAPFLLESEGHTTPMHEWTRDPPPKGAPGAGRMAAAWRAAPPSPFSAKPLPAMLFLGGGYHPLL